MIETVKPTELTTPEARFNKWEDIPKPRYEDEWIDRLEAVSIEPPVEYRLEGAKAPIYLATVALSEWQYLSIKRHFGTFEEGFDEMLQHAGEYYLPGFDRELTEEGLEEMDRDHREGLCLNCLDQYDVTGDWSISCDECPAVVKTKESARQEEPSTSEDGPMEKLQDAAGMMEKSVTSGMPQGQSEQLAFRF